MRLSRMNWARPWRVQPVSSSPDPCCRMSTSARTGPKNLSASRAMAEIAKGYFTLNSHLRMFAVTVSHSSAPHQYPRGIPESGRAPWHVPRDDAARPDYGVVSYRDAGQNNGAAANPHIATDHNRPAKLRSRPSCRGIPWMIGRVYLNCGSDLCSCADTHRHDVENHAIEIQKDIIPQRDVLAKVAMERRAD